MFFLYNIIIHGYAALIKMSAPINTKARLWTRGRRNIFQKLNTDIQGKDRLAWFHAASLGEFEQGRPVLEAFRKKHPDFKILLTFFSPSGYEIRKNYKGADFIYYLPIDTPRNAQRFIATVNPSVVFFIKYEYWFNYLKYLKRAQIPVYMVSAIVRPDQHFFKPYGGWFRKQLFNIRGFFVQEKQSASLLKSIGIQQVLVSGDTRFDRVQQVAEQKKDFPLVRTFADGHPMVLAGSSWPPDEKILARLADSGKLSCRFIVAPHEIHEDRIASIENLFSKHKTIRYSQLDEAGARESDVLIVDGIGFLSSLYQYCTVAVIGGGFGAGIHNILEAVTFGKPVVFGPKYTRFAEAVSLVKLGGAFEVNEKTFSETLQDLFNDKASYNKASAACKDYIQKNTGATKIILDNISI